MKDSVDSKRFLINVTKLLSMIFLCANIFFIAMTLNEQLAIGSTNGNGQMFFFNLKIPHLPK